MTEQKNTQTAGMMFMGMIFFLFGFVTTFNITLADKFKSVFELSNFQAQLVNGAFFFTYFLLAFTAGGVIKKIGYKGGVILVFCWSLQEASFSSLPPKQYPFHSSYLQFSLWQVA